MDEDSVYVKVMADYLSTGLWNQYGTNVDVDVYNLSPEIVHRLAKWQARFDKECLIEDEGAFDYDSFSKEGELIARHIKAMHPSWTVMYYNEAQFIAHAGEGRPFVYEIK